MPGKSLDAGRAEAQPSSASDSQKGKQLTAQIATRSAAPTSRPTSSTSVSAVAPDHCLGQRHVEASSSGDKDNRAAVEQLFVAADADGDGLLSPCEFATARSVLMAAAAKEPVKSLADGDFAGKIGREDIVTTVLGMMHALKISSTDLVQHVNKVVAGKSNSFDKSVSDLRHAIVRNVSGLPDDSIPRPLWRTATGRGNFPLPPGVARGPAIARMAFKVLQYLAMRTEDATILEGELLSKVESHRQTFKKLLDRAGEIAGAQVLPASAGRKSVDLFLMKSPTTEVYHVCLQNLQLSAGPDPRIEGIGGFDVGPIEEAAIPKELLAAMCSDLCRSETAPAGSGANSGPEPLRTFSQGEIDLQNAPLMLTASAAARHILRIQFKLVGNELSKHYIVLIPKLRTVHTGHARYASHEVSFQGLARSSATEFSNFVIVNVPGDQLNRFVVKHEFVNQQVRVARQDGMSESKMDGLVPVPVISPEERASNLACEVERIRSLLSGQGLGRRSGERDIAYAMRLGRQLRHGYKYDVELTDAELQRLPTLIWEAKRGDCSAFNAGFVFALRAHQIPARLSLGFKYGQAVRDACGSVIAPHAQCEFFAEDIGWVPCDATGGVHRLGHEGTAALSFLEFRPAGLTPGELQDLEGVLGPGVGPADLLRSSPQTSDVLLAAGCSASDPPASELNRLALAYKLGEFRDLRACDLLTDSARAGAKMLEGGPFHGQPLKLSQLNENMLVPAEIDAVMDHLKVRPRTEDWSKMWPYGVISCHYELEEGLP